MLQETFIEIIACTQTYICSTGWKQCDQGWSAHHRAYTQVCIVTVLVREHFTTLARYTVGVPAHAQPHPAVHLV